MEKHLVLSPRLSCLRDWVVPGARLVDVGTDHGFLPTCLLLEDVCQTAIASDIGKGPLESARKTAERHGVLDRMIFVQSDGLEQISPEDVDTIVIAGMGGETMIHILEHAPWVNNPAYTLLLQPMSKVETLGRSCLVRDMKWKGNDWWRSHPFYTMPFWREAEVYPRRCGTLCCAMAAWHFGTISGDPLLKTYCDGTIQKLNRPSKDFKSRKSRKLLPAAGNWRWIGRP